MHKVNPVNDTLDIEVMDQPGAGGAHHHYNVTGFSMAGNPSLQGSTSYLPSLSKAVIIFQNGPIGENGVNGLTQEVLLAIVAHRLECFQAGPYACEENAHALTHVHQALGILKGRTLARMKRGVEGTMAK